MQLLQRMLIIMTHRAGPEIRDDATRRLAHWAETDYGLSMLSSPKVKATRRPSNNESQWIYADHRPRINVMRSALWLLNNSIGLIGDG